MSFHSEDGDDDDNRVRAYIRRLERNGVYISYVKLHRKDDHNRNSNHIIDSLPSIAALRPRQCSIQRNHILYQLTRRRCAWNQRHPQISNHQVLSIRGLIQSPCRSSSKALSRQPRKPSKARMERKIALTGTGKLSGSKGTQEPDSGPYMGSEMIKKKKRALRTMSDRMVSLAGESNGASDEVVRAAQHLSIQQSVSIHRY